MMEYWRERNNETEKDKERMKERKTKNNEGEKDKKERMKDKQEIKK